MTLPLTLDVLAAAYDYVRATNPFCKWNLPESEDVKFIVDRKHDTAGWYRFENGRHTIGISSKCIGHSHTLIRVMAHEAIHLFQRDSSMETKGAMHNAAFRKLAARVARIHGFDPMEF